MLFLSLVLFLFLLLRISELNGHEVRSTVLYTTWCKKIYFWTLSPYSGDRIKKEKGGIMVVDQSVYPTWQFSPCAAIYC